MLYKRDYSSLTEGEQDEFREIQRCERLDYDGSLLFGKLHKNLYRTYPKAARHHVSLFPNNYLDQCDLIDDKAKLVKLIGNYREVIDQPDIKELQVKAWILENEAYHLVGSVLSQYNFGHHEAFMFKEFPLGTLYPYIR